MPSATPAIRKTLHTDLHAFALSVLTVAMLGAALYTTGALAATPGESAPRSVGTYPFAIAQQPLVSALNEFSRITGWQVGVSADLAKDVVSPGAIGTLPADKALDKLLAGSHLGYRNLGNNNVVLEKRSSGALALEQITVSATRQAQEVATVPSSVSVHDRAELDRLNVNNIRDLVRYEPGISVGGAGQRAGTTGYNIRGIDGDRILTQVDGV
jgi:hemoglobin/transferrin/lactoferrin receptor protein